MIITRGFGGGNFILRGFQSFWKKVKEVIHAVIQSGGLGTPFIPLRKKLKPLFPLVPLWDVIKSITIFNCPYCNFSISNLNLIDMARHIRETHPDKLVSMSKQITKAVSLGYSDIEALILSPEDKVPEQYNKKPLIAQETISVRVKKETLYNLEKGKEVSL